jgi:ABC-type Mn2+/Zn2+ transport system ATPase subunit
MDIESRGQTYRMIKRLKDDGVSIIIATHEFQTIAHLCDDHLSLESGMLKPQTVEQAGGERKIIPYG